MTPTLDKPLTPKEMQVALLIGEGWSAKEIAHCLGWSVRSVQSYTDRLAWKIGGKGRPRERIVRWTLTRGE